MALTRDRILHDSHMGSVQVSDLSARGICELQEYHKAVPQGDATEKTSGFVKNYTMITHSSSFSGPSSTNSNGLVFRPSHYQPEDAHSSVITFKTGYDSSMHTSGYLLNFQQKDQLSENTCLKINNQNDDEYSIWEDNMDRKYQWNQVNPMSSASPRLLEDFNSFQRASSTYGSVTDTGKEDQLREEPFGWLYSEATAISAEESGTQEACLHKRPHTGEDMQAWKRHCTGATRKPKPKSIPDSQSIAAKNRRERISERLKTLQDLVPNGSKVDLVTMLEKAISYVKFLQLQVKVLATDEFWPVQGGKAPDIAQVKEAIDAILSSQRDGSSS